MPKTEVTRTPEQFRAAVMRYFNDLLKAEQAIIRDMGVRHKTYSQNFLKENKVVYKNILISSIAVAETTFGIDKSVFVVCTAPHGQEVEENLSRGTIKPLTAELEMWIKTKVIPKNPAKGYMFLKRGVIPVGAGKDKDSIYSKFPDGVRFMERGFEYVASDDVAGMIVDAHLKTL